MSGVKGRSGGANRKSIQEHKLTGTYRNGRHAGVIQEEPMLVSPENYITEDFTNNKAKLFERFSSILHEEGLTSGQVDSLFVSQIVDLYAAYVEAAAIYAHDGVVAKIGNKLAITLMVELQKELRVLLGEYSLTPSTRAAQVRSGGDAVVDDPIAEFLTNGPPRLVGGGDVILKAYPD